MDVPDLVVPVREGPVNRSLRYALRSWAENLPHRRVWVVGHLPSWVAQVGHIPTRQDGTKWKNTTAAVRAACAHTEVSRQWLLMNDDFFIMQPLPDGMPVLHRGLVRDVEEHYAEIVSGRYLAGMRETRELLADLGHPEPLSYELHVPLLVDSDGMLDALDLGQHVDVLHKRTLYGNLTGLGGEQIDDVKILHRAPRGYGPDSRYLSTMPDAFANGYVGQFIRGAFPQPCRYEHPGRR